MVASIWLAVEIVRPGLHAGQDGGGAAGADQLGRAAALAQGGLECRDDLLFQEIPAERRGIGPGRPDPADRPAAIAPASGRCPGR